MENIEKTIRNILEEHKIYPRYVAQSHPLPIWMVTIDGDWKHDHLYAQHLLEENGFELLKEDSLPSDSDCYTSTHYYMFHQFCRR